MAILVQRLTQDQLVSLMQGLTIHIAVNNGLGRRTSFLDRQQYEAVAKVSGVPKASPGFCSTNNSLQAIYASQILQIIVLCLSKLSLLLVYIKLTPVPKMLIIIWTSLSFVTLWGIAAVVTLAIQCTVPAPWDFLQRRCIDRVSSDEGGGIYEPKRHAVCSKIYKWHHQPSHRCCYHNFAGHDHLARFAEKR